MNREEVAVTANARKVLEERYLRKDENRRIVETPSQMFWRVANFIAAADAGFESADKAETSARQFYRAMANLEFLPNSPTLMNAGNPLGQLMACFVLPVADSLDAILDTFKQAAIIQRTGGGTGFSFSRLRPRGDIVMSTKGLASGPVSFIELFDAMTNVIKQGSTRRGANMGILRVDHPDIQEFIRVKGEPGKITNFNLSVGITREFMEAVEKDSLYPLINPRNGQITGRWRAQTVFELIARMAWESGEPGVVFLDRINEDNPTPKLGEIEATNPCSEQPLLPYEACCLASINLGKVLRPEGDRNHIDWEKLENLVALGIHFLDNVVEINNYPLPETAQICRGNRKIGLGLMGFADLLILLGIPYDSSEASSLAEKVMSFVQTKATEASVDLAKVRGVFPNFAGSIYDGPGGSRQRNATLTTIAPTGTISIIADCASGIEPLFALSYVRQAFEGVSLPQAVYPRFIEAAKKGGFFSEEFIREVAKRGTVRGMQGVPEEIQRVFVTAHDVSPEWHVRMQAAFQKFTQNGVSKTVNLPESATVDDVRQVFREAHNLGCKGVTVYRYGSRPTQILNIHGYCLGCAAEDAFPPDQNRLDRDLRLRQAS